MTKSISAAAAAPVMIDETDLSIAWAKVLINLCENPGTEISPLIVSLTGFNENGVISENLDYRNKVDAALKEKGFIDIEEVAFTIFPERYLKIAGGNRQKLFDLYRRCFPRMKLMKKSLNNRGLYFERLTMFGDGPCDGNQLEWILSMHAERSGVRKSMYQAAVFDPARDHVKQAQLGFPCLQHVTFETTNAGLVVNAFYATQQMFNKAYGNYLGLAQLGTFMAGEMGTKLARLNVFIGIARLDKITKSDPVLQHILEASHQLVAVADKKQLEIA